MLVLSRRPSEKVVFPGLDASVQVVSVRGSTVRLGVEAPRDVAVVRGELLDPGGPPPHAPAAARQARHRLCNRLNAATVGLALLRHQLRRGLTAEAEATLDTVSREIDQMRPLLEAGPAAPRRRALLVEDDRNQRELLAGYLRLAGLDVDTAGDGSDALDHLRDRGRPDVLLLDMVLPRCDGPTTLRTIRRDPAYAGLPIFGLSGFPREEFNLDAGPDGINGWYQKPIDPDALLQDLSRALDARTDRLQPATANRTVSRAQAARK